MRKILAVLLIISVVGLAGAQTECSVAVKDEATGIEAVAEACDNIGVFSIGGKYMGEWKKLTYHFPEPWRGTYTTYHIDGSDFCTSSQARNCTQLDPYVDAEPKVIDGQIHTSWLVDGVHVTQTLKIADNMTVIGYAVQNQDNKNHTMSIRVNLDTMLGYNDGAPIYVPTDGLKTTETQYLKKDISFGYFKAYNEPTQPTIVATATFNPQQGMDMPDKFIIADWKHSKTAAYFYTPQGREITGDSSVLLYYELGEIVPKDRRLIRVGYGYDQPVIRKNKSSSVGFADIILDRVNGKYCPGEEVVFKVDVLNIGEKRKANADLIVYDGQKKMYNASIFSEFEKDKVKTLDYRWVLGEHSKDTSYSVKTVLRNETHTLDTYEKQNAFAVEMMKCENPYVEATVKATKSVFLGSVFLAFLLFIAFALIAVAYYLMNMGEVKFTKYVDGEQVFVVVENNTRKTMRDVVIKEPIPTETEVKVDTVEVLRTRTHLIWEPKTVKPGERATLQYWIRDGRAIAGSKLNWDKGALDAQ